MSVKQDTPRTTARTFHYAKVLNHKDDVEGYLYSPTALTQTAWNLGEHWNLDEDTRTFEPPGHWWEVDERATTPTYSTCLLWQVYDKGARSNIIANIVLAAKPDGVTDEDMAVIKID